VVDAPTPANQDKLATALRLWRAVEDVGPNWVLRAERLLRGLMDILDGFAAVWVLAALHERPTPVGAVYAGWDDPKRQSLANAYLSQLLSHPLAIHGLSVPKPAEHLSRAAAIDDATWYDSEFFRDVAKPLGIDDTIHSSQTLCEREVMSIVHVYRAAGAPSRFGPDDCAAVVLIHEHLLTRLRSDLPAAVDLPPAASTAEGAVATGRLSPKQRIALRLLLSGDSEKQIAAKLRRSPHTVHMHVKAVYRALGVTSRAELFSKFLHRPDRPTD
jgi:DNA-binding CsgD family transcriptional regulator